MKSFDVIVVGLGIMGVSSALQIATAGKKVAAFESFGPDHNRSSSHGGGRIFRRAYWEGRKYLPMLKLAHEEWQKVQAEFEDKFLFPSGGLFIGPEMSKIVRMSVQTAHEEKIEYDILRSSDINRSFPQFRTTSNSMAVWEPGGYAISADLARAHMRTLAIQRSAQFYYGKHVVSLSTHTETGGVIATTDNGEKFLAEHAVICTGPLIASELVPELKPYIRPQHIPVYWFAPMPRKERGFISDKMPVFLIENADGSLLYGLPSDAGPEGGVKIGYHNRQLTDIRPANLIDSIPPLFEDEISRGVADVIDGLQPRPIMAKLCTYTMCVDESFLLGASVRQPAVFYASACSGHGFKFAPAVGMVMADLVCGRRPSVDIADFHISRFDGRMP